MKLIKHEGPSVKKAYCNKSFCAIVNFIIWKHINVAISYVLIRGTMDNLECKGRAVRMDLVTNRV